MVPPAKTKGNQIWGRNSESRHRIRETALGTQSTAAVTSLSVSRPCSSKGQQHKGSSSHPEKRQMSASSKNKCFQTVRKRKGGRSCVCSGRTYLPFTLSKKGYLFRRIAAHCLFPIPSDYGCNLSHPGEKPTTSNCLLRCRLQAEERERERERDCSMCVCVTEKKTETPVCVCVCVCERERERESVCVWGCM